MPSREYLQITQESSYGTTATPTVGTNSFYARLHEDDTFTAQDNPVQLDIPYGGGRATPADMVSDQYACTFAFKSYLYPGAYSATLLNWATGVINSPRDFPWATTDAGLVMPPGDLASLSFAHSYYVPDGTYKQLIFTGAKCLTWNVAASRQDPRFLFTCTGQAIKGNATTNTAPTETQYPLGPYLFSHTGGNLQLINTGSSMRTQYDSVSISGSNVMDPNWFESQYVQLIRFCGRTTTLDLNLYLKPSPDDLGFLQSKTALKSSLVINNGTNSLTFNFNSKNYLKAVTRNLAVGRVYKTRVRAQNYWDPVAGTDFTFTAA